MKKEKIRVLNIQESISSGGVERRRLSLSKLLDKSRFDLKIICTVSRRSIADEISNNGVEVIPIGLLQSPFEIQQHKKVMRIIDEFKPHIIHGAVFEGVIMAAVNGWIKNVPVVIIEETSDPVTRSWKGNMLMKFFSYISDMVVGVSPAAVDYLLQKLNIKKSKVRLINNGVAAPRAVTNEEIACVKNELGIKPDEIIIGSTGRMLNDDHKRFSDLIKAFSIVVKTGVNAKLVLIGEGPEMIKYKALCEELGISQKVVFPGYQSDIVKYYKIFDIFSLVSAYEAFGLVVAEAMLNHLPVVATNVGGIKHIVVDNETGYLVEKFDVNGIAEKLKLLCNDVNLRNVLGNNGHNRASEHYTEERYVRDVESLYYEMLDKKKITY